MTCAFCGLTIDSGAPKLWVAWADAMGHVHVECYALRTGTPKFPKKAK